MRGDRVAIIGGGIGGLAAAASLATHGLDVRLFEALPHLGGKIRQVAPAGAAAADAPGIDMGIDTGIDTGPTVFTMRWVFEELFAEAGTSLGSHLDLAPLDILARHAWRSSGPLDLYADAARSEDAIGAFAGAAEARGFRRFCERAARVYGHLDESFMRQPEPRFDKLAVSLAFRPTALWDISPYTTLWSALGTFFSDPRLLQLFGRYATYCGSSPFLAPATLMLVAHVEQCGVWRIAGGMSALAQAVADIATDKGARLHTHTRVVEILSDRAGVTGLRLASGEVVEADAIICNGDVAALASGALGSEAQRLLRPVPREDRSLSALTWVLTARTGGFPLARHNVFFSDDYRGEFEDILERRTLPRDPTIYLCAETRGDSGDETLEADDRLLCLVNAPADGDSSSLSDEDIAQCRKTVERRLNAQGLDLAVTSAWSLTGSPRIFDTMFPATGGALYGPATHGWSASFARAGSRTRMPGLYLAGGSVHPGPGVPMAALSGRMAAAQLMADLTSLRRSRPTATRGGTSTR
jgi:1-hydroxycarotenoid 3,4-desaturase